MELWPKCLIPEIVLREGCCPESRGRWKVGQAFQIPLDRERLTSFILSISGQNIFASPFATGI